MNRPASTVGLTLDHSGAGTISVSGPVNASTGSWLSDLVEAAPELGVRRLVVELADVAGYDTPGALAVQHCQRMGRSLPMELVFRARGRAGGALLLASLLA